MRQSGCSSSVSRSRLDFSSSTMTNGLLPVHGWVICAEGRGAQLTPAGHALHRIRYLDRPPICQALPDAGGRGALQAAPRRRPRCGPSASSRVMSASVIASSCAAPAIRRGLRRGAPAIGSSHQALLRAQLRSPQKRPGPRCRWRAGFPAAARLRPAAGRQGCRRQISRSAPAAVLPATGRRPALRGGGGCCWQSRGGNRAAS